METLKRSWRRTPKIIRQVLVTIVGVLVILVGVIMLITPGPGWVAIFLGLAILSTEFEWAKRLRDWAIKKFKSAYESFKNRHKHTNHDQK